MSSRATWFWFVLAAVLFGVVVIHERNKRARVTGPVKILPGLKAAEVTSIQVRPRDQLEMQVTRTNDGWQLTTRSLPFAVPAQSSSIDTFLGVLERLAPVATIGAAELKDRPKAEEEYGLLASPQFSVVIEQGNAAPLHLLVGNRTAPGDQVFLQRVAQEGVYVADAGMLKNFPRTADDWRDTTFVTLKGVAIDHVTATNGATSFDLQRTPGTKQWRMVWPPPPTRASNDKVEAAMESIEHLRILQFVSDDANADLESRGLQPPELEVAFGQGSNTAVTLQFGKSPTNDPQQVYARRAGQTGIVTVSRDVLAPWRLAVNDFRDAHLLTLSEPIDAVEVFGEDHFLVGHPTNDEWRVYPQNFPADTTVLREMVGDLSGMDAQFAKAVVTEPDLQAYGLAPAARRYVLRTGPVDPASPGTNGIMADLSFGTNKDDRVFARRADESFVYSVKLSAFSKLPSASWQLRERQVWNFSEDEVTSVTIRQNGKVRKMLHKGPHSWAFAPGSQGILEDLAVDATVRGLTRLKAVIWAGRGVQKRAQFGFKEGGHQITLELKGGEKLTIEFGGDSPVTTFPYAAVQLEGGLWVMEFPWALYRDVLGCLSNPPGP